jgi:cyclopropane-fatty-acyl-phospholipid synthase
VFDQLKLSAWTSGIRSKFNLPLRVELWNGAQVDLSPEQPRVKIRVPNPGGLRYLLAPSLGNLGEAYVDGALVI